MFNMQDSECASVMTIMTIYPFKRQPHKMVKHTQTSCRQKPTNCFSMFDHFVGLALKGLSPVFLNPIQTNSI